MKSCNICDAEMPDGSKHERCTQCRNRLRYWQAKRPAQRLARKARLAVWKSRLDTFGDKEKK